MNETDTIYGGLSPKRLSATETAQYVRSRLRACFPGIKFTVRTEKYANGASIRIGWTDGPTVRDVENSCAHFERSWFDGMTESKHYKDDVLLLAPDGTFELVSPGVDYVNGYREISETFEAVLVERASALVREQAGEQFSMERTYMTGFDTEFGMCPSHHNGYGLVRWLSNFITAPAAASEPRARSRRSAS